MKDYALIITPTTLVRKLMHVHGANPTLIFTNSYDHCRTVKCYARQIADIKSFKQDLLQLFVKLEFGCPQVYTTERGLIVRIPRSLQR